MWTPQEVTKEEKEIIEKFKESPNFQPKPDRSEKSFFAKIKEMFG